MDQDSRVKGMVKRLVFRSVVFALLTIIGFAATELLVYLGKERISDINSRFPELLMIIRAAAIMTWVEISLFWIRIGLQPQIDVQASAKTAESQPMAAAIVYITHQLTWVIRMVLFLKLCGLLNEVV